MRAAVRLDTSNFVANLLKSSLSTQKVWNRVVDGRIAFFIGVIGLTILLGLETSEFRFGFCFESSSSKRVNCQDGSY